MKITKITKLHQGMYAHICPLCGEIHATVSDVDIMPEFSICNCDKNGNKIPVFEIFESGGKQMIRRNKYPRFVGEVTFGKLSDIEHIDVIDKNADVMEVTSALRKAGEFLIKKSRYGKAT